jgi:hypothetical protein
MKKHFNPKILTALLLLIFLCGAAIAYSQMRNIPPSGPNMDMVNMQQIQALRAELAKLRVDLIACHDELNEVRKQLELCEKGATAESDKSKAPEKKGSDSTPAP